MKSNGPLKSRNQVRRHAKKLLASASNERLRDLAALALRNPAMVLARPGMQRDLLRASEQ